MAISGGVWWWYGVEHAFDEDLVVGDDALHGAGCAAEDGGGEEVGGGMRT